VALLRAWLEKAKEAASAGDAAVSAHLIDCGRLFSRSWASVEFLHRAAHGTGKVPCSSCCAIIHTLSLILPHHRSPHPLTRHLGRCR
jgi:hypothetical protein